VTTSTCELETICREQLDRYFAAHPNATLQRHALLALRMVASEEHSLTGKPEGWAAGIIYAMANLYRQACGVPGLLNCEFEAFFTVSMGTVRRRASQVTDLLPI
jgi:Domain of unknown function (DUF6398)